MNRNVMVALGLLASVTSTATAKVVCLKKSLSGPLHVRESCKAKEAKLGSFDAVQALLAALSVENGGTTIRLSGVNLQIVSGSGATDGPINGKGNLIVGYDEPLTEGTCGTGTSRCVVDADCAQGEPCHASTTLSTKTGSHNLIVGTRHTYSSYGGFVAGDANSVTGPFTSVSGGVFNLAGSGFPPSGGPSPIPHGQSAAVSGGIGNFANGAGASVGGGIANAATGDGASVSGGFQSQATGLAAGVSGGLLNLASGVEASVCGGIENVAGAGTPLFIFAGATGQGVTVSGGANNIANGSAASVTGGKNNVISGDFSSVGGGTVPEVTGTNEWHATITSGFPSTTEY